MNYLPTTSSTIDSELQVGSHGWVDACFRDMQRRAAGGASYSARAYFQEGLSEDVCVDLIYGEFVLRSESANFDREVFLRSYSTYQSLLRSQLDFDQAFTDSTTSAKSIVTVARAAPERIGKYSIVGPLGAGTQATAYIAIHPELAQEVVIKLSKTPAKGRTDPLFREGQVLASLEHCCIAQVYDVGVHEGHPFLVTRLVRGVTLDIYTAQQCPSAVEACRLIRMIAEGLAEAHRQGVWHLDIKPQNIVMAENGQPKLIDFGLAFRCHAYDFSPQEPGALRGTLPFMSPEQAHGDTSLIDHRSDIFSLGALLFYLCTGKCAYPQKDFFELLKEVRIGNWQKQLLEQSGVPAGIQRIVHRAMHPVIEERFSSANELVHAIDAELSSLRRAPLNRRVLLGGGAALFALASFGVYWSTPLQRHAACTERVELGIDVFRNGAYHSLVDCVPIETGERLRITADIPADHSAALFVLSSEGDFRLLSTHKAVSVPASLRFPVSENDAVPLIGSSGTELFVLCVQHSGSASEDLRLRLEKQKLAAVKELSVLASNESAVFYLQSTRDIGDPVTTLDSEASVRQQLDAIRANISQRVDHFRALAFRHVD